MAELSDRYALPLLQAGQAQKEVTHNGAVAAIDALLHLAVVSRVAASPPVRPAAGSAWIVPAAPAGIWTGHAGRLAFFDSAGWRFVDPRSGCLAYVIDEGVFAVFTGAAWKGDAWPVGGLAIGARTMFAAEPASLAAVTGGTVIDTQARTAISALTEAMRAMGLVANV